jgi:exopolysaccharide biosynthesis WecB/TagA/CpsF family protein
MSAAVRNLDFGGIQVSGLTLADLLSLIQRHITDRARLDITYLNPDYARRAFKDEGLRDRINRFDLVLVDGNGVRLLAPLFGFRIPARLDTDSVAPRVFGLLEHMSAAVFLFGSEPGMAERAAGRLRAAYPGLPVAGTAHGFHDVQRGHPGWFAPEDSDRIVDQMNASGAAFILVGLPTPLQQDWVVEHRDRIEAAVVMTAGSYLDHMAGSAAWPRSWYPEWADRFGLNWFYRLTREPGRLWRRYSVEFVSFVLLAVRARIAGLKDGSATHLHRPPVAPRSR